MPPKGADEVSRVSNQACWPVNPRRGCGIAPTPIFHPIGRRRRLPTQSPAQRVCVGEEERWSERALPDPGEARDTKSATTKWPGRNSDQPLRFCAPEMLQNPAGTRPPAILWVLSHRWESTSPPAGGETPLRKEPSSGPMRASGPTKKRSIVAPSSVWPSASHLPPRGKAFGESAPRGKA